VEGAAISKTTALGAIVSKMDPKGSIMRLRTNKSAGLGVLEAIEPDAELFALAEQVDLADKAFHDAVARRNEAQIAYFREPSIITQVAFEGAKTAEAVALETLDAEVSWLAGTRATTVIGLKLKASKWPRLVDVLRLSLPGKIARRPKPLSLPPQYLS
jgi:hypothetical protein